VRAAHEFAEFTGGAVSLATIHGLDLIFVQTVRLSEPMAHTPEIGSTGPLFKSAMGRSAGARRRADGRGGRGFRP
jgi:DNA-binding IclR family transcriptional regulator